MQYRTLSNGVELPMIGYGTFQIRDAAQCEQCVTNALEAGYRLFDTAASYENEAAVGAALRSSGVPREELFLITKLWVQDAGYDGTLKAFDRSLKKLGLGHIDLYLIHQPFGDYYGTWRAMEEAYRAGKVRAIGVSNFYPDRLIDLCNFVDIKPAVNQVETHVFCQQKAAHEVMQRHGVQIESWGPFAEGKNGLFTNPVLQEIGAAHAKSAAQVALRFLLQSGVAVIPKSVRKERMAENFDVFGFSLSDEEMARIAALDTGRSAFFSHYDPDTVEWFMTFAKE